MNQLELTPGWIPTHVDLEGVSLSINGLNPWHHEWLQLSTEVIYVSHPSYPTQVHPAWVYEIETAGKRARFAAAELSNGVWGFYIPAITPPSAAHPPPAVSPNHP